MNIRTIVLALAALSLCTYSASADVPGQINFQGTLADSTGNPITGTRSLDFSIYDQETLGIALWTETQPSVEIEGGFFNVILGSVVPLSGSIFTGDILWLEIGVNSEALAPRTRLVSTPYGFRAAYADTSEFSRVGAPDDDWTFSGNNIYRNTGNVGIGTDNPTTKLYVADGISGSYGYMCGSTNTVYGQNSNGNYGYLGGNSYGGYGRHNSSNNYGYIGSNNYGAYGYYNSTGNFGYLGGISYGAYGRHQSSLNYGLLGAPSSGVQGTWGLVSNSGYLGEANYGVRGLHYVSGNWGYIGSANYGVYGRYSSIGNWGYIGSADYGVYGRHHSTGNFGCLGDTSYGVRGVHTAGGNNGYIGSTDYGVYGKYNSNGNYGYLGSSAYGAYGKHSPTGNWGTLGDTDYGVYGRYHTTGNYGALGDSSYGVKGFHQLSANLGYLGSYLYGAYGTHYATGNWGYLGSYMYGVYGVHDATGNWAGLGGSSMAVQGNALSDNSYGGYFHSGGNNGIGIYAHGSTGGCAAMLRGNVIIMALASGDTILELGEGLDYAEEFDVTQTEDISPGAVLIIDPDNPGKLTLSYQPYDSKVAGIVAGAKGLGSGVRLGTGQSDHNVALAGRVYCNVDASETDIEPGDLLTTSSIPGYAMKVTDYARTQGAILGKAMERLEKGQRAQILVLVTLQ